MISPDQDQNPGRTEKRVCLGKIVAAHGIKGQVKILPYGDDPALIETLGPVYISGSGSETLSVSLKNPAGKYLVADIKGIGDRNAAEALRGTELFVAKDRLPKIEDSGTYYHSDLIGLKAVDESGAEVGKVIDVQNFGAGDLLEIRPLQGESFYLPFHNKTVPRIDIAGGFVILSGHEGFMIDA